MAGPVVVAVLSAGRSGTRWLAGALRELYPGLDVEHHPIGARYAPRLYFRRYDDPAAILDVPEVRRHVLRIENGSRQYVETGWPLFPALPLLAARLGDRLRVVHLTRHPVPTALSHLAHRIYAGSERDDAYTRLATLSPFDAGVFQPGYAWTWDQLSPYEKCLFWWTEVNLFGLELPGRLVRIPLLRIKSEELCAGESRALRRLLDFIELPWDPRWPALVRAGVARNRWHHDATGRVDPLQLHRHPVAVEVSRELGYDVSGLNVGQLEAQYESQ